MKLLLISKTKIVIQIFELICKKMDFELSVRKDNEVTTKFDIIVVDEEFVDDRFNIIKQLCKKIGAITNEELSSYSSKYFKLKRPFLPMQLHTVLEEQKALILEDEELANEIKEEVDTTDEIAHFVDSLADDLSLGEDYEEDESIVTLESLNDGGVLDSFELDKITDILHQNEIKHEFKNEIEMEDHDWRELSDIIDDALDEVQGYEFSMTNEPINLILNNYQIDELKPLLQKFNQGIIDRLANGDSIDLRLSLKGTN